MTTNIDPQIVDTIAEVLTVACDDGELTITGARHDDIAEWIIEGLQNAGYVFAGPPPASFDVARIKVVEEDGPDGDDIRIELDVDERIHAAFQRATNAGINTFDLRVELDDGADIVSFDGAARLVAQRPPTRERMALLVLYATRVDLAAHGEVFR